jgi:hypothetical protein
MKDPIVEEVRKARQDHAKEFRHDLAAICNDLRRIEIECGHRLVVVSNSTWRDGELTATLRQPFDL